MFTYLIALTLLIAAVGTIYYLLKNMGEDGIEVAAPTSCKSGRCGVRKDGGCGQADAEHVAPAALADGTSRERENPLEELPQHRPG